METLLVHLIKPFFMFAVLVLAIPIKMAVYYWFPKGRVRNRLLKPINNRVLWLEKADRVMERLVLGLLLSCIRAAKLEKILHRYAVGRWLHNTLYQAWAVRSAKPSVQGLHGVREQQ